MSVYGDLIMGPNTTISIAGGNSDSHGIYIYHPTVTTTSQRIEMVGSTGMPETTLSSAISSKQGFLAVASATSYGVGEWISAFKRGLTDVAQRNDEGFIVHEVSGNTIYVREFVGPSATIIEVDGSTITVDNAKVFRKWQTLIFGTGADRNVLNITDINYISNVITFNASVTGSVAGLTVYTTGPIRTKSVGDIVRKVAYVLIQDQLSTSTTFVVSNAAGLDIGDEVVVDSLLESDNFTDERPERRTIIVGNTITVNSSFGYPLFTGAFCVKLTRNCKIETNDTGTNYGFFRIIENNSYSLNYKLVMRDVEFRNLGTSIDDFRSRSSPMLNGRYTNDLGYDGVEIEGITSHRDETRNLSNSGFYLYRFCYRWTVRNCIVWNSVQGLWQERGYEHDDMAWYNNYSARSEGSLFRWQEMRYEYNEFAYNYAHRGDDQAILVSGNRATGVGMHHNWVRVSQSTGVNFNINYGSFAFFQNRIEGCFNSSIYGFNNGMGNFIYNYIDTARPLDFTISTDIHTTRMGLDPNQSAIMLEHNYEIDAVVEFFPGGKRTWVESEKAWFVEHDDDAFSSTVGSGHSEVIYIPPGMSFKVRVEVKLSDGFSGTAPKLEIREITNRGATSHTFIAGHNGNPLIPYVASTTATIITGWQNVDITVPATEYGTRYIIASIPQSGNSSSALGEGWYEKPFKIYLDNSLKSQNYAGINKYSASEIGVKNSFDTQIIRIGGRYK
jgi:hypothetical protein